MARTPIDIRGATVLVVGLNVTGQSCARALPKFGANVIVTDVRENLDGLDGAISAVNEAGAGFLPLKEAALLRPEILVISPGLSPEDSRVLPLRNNAGEWMSDPELAFRLSRGRVVGVTGTNGKTTVTTLAGRMVAAEFADTRVCGNIGIAYIDAVEGSTDETVFVVELSSYQLEGCSQLKPDAAIVLNVQPDHATRHATLEIYADVKARILSAMDESGFAVLNGDDMRVADMAEKTAAKPVMFSVEEELFEGAYLDGDDLVMKTGGVAVALGRASALQIPGVHNVSNVLAAGSAAYLMGVPAEKISAAAAAFEGIEHRIEFAGDVKGIQCVNDSKATNPDSTLAALETFRGRAITVILGGDDKNMDYEPVYEKLEALSAKAIVMGPGLKRVAKEIKEYGGIECEVAADMDEAVRKGIEMTAGGGVLLLSPGSSSFDLYKNFEERGRHFKDAVKRSQG